MCVCVCVCVCVKAMQINANTTTTIQGLREQTSLRLRGDGVRDEWRNECGGVEHYQAAHSICFQTRGSTELSVYGSDMSSDRLFDPVQLNRAYFEEDNNNDIGLMLKT